MEGVDMAMQRKVWTSLLSIGLLLGTGASAIATPEQPASHTKQFQPMQQPLSWKIGVTLGGLGLIGLELWWFLLSKTKAKKAESREGVQAVKITVNAGYEPNRILVQTGQLVKLTFLRQDPSSCLEKVLFPDFRIAADLPLNQETTIEFTPGKPGEYQFTCGMNMFRGIVEVQ
jgi:plastocyanin domain-containing protein